MADLKCRLKKRVPFANFGDTYNRRTKLGKTVLIRKRKIKINPTVLAAGGITALATGTGIYSLLQARREHESYKATGAIRKYLANTNLPQYHDFVGKEKEISQVLVKNPEIAKVIAKNPEAIETVTRNFRYLK